ncbi:hypothetical protein QCD70_17165 [Agreia sp. PsM10]|uniref:hypothetical protein n=1 Tax=Agreia sp. PsM10 TaxID=3030533 RepID=UPI00263B8505|nr:hypothetical protein [Agreia sp. PsM10]MDN4641979.1 hypothetical protein [Agreia sp. PsM10]
MSISRRSFIAGATGAAVIPAIFAPQTAFGVRLPAALSTQLLAKLVSGGAFAGTAFVPSTDRPDTIVRTSRNGTLTTAVATDSFYPLQRDVVNFAVNPSFSGAVVGVLGAGGMLPTAWKIGDSDQYRVEVRSILPNAVVLGVTSPASGIFFFDKENSSSNRHT